jgi:diacylglycerol O-acyltransferase
MIMKLHHALLDGPSGAELMVQLLDLERAPATVPVPNRPLAIDPQPSRSELARVAARRASRGGPRGAAELRKAVGVLAAMQRWDRAHPDVELPGALGAPRTSFNQPITARRTVRFTGVPLDVLDKVRRDTGSTVNDVVLAITGGALRRYLSRGGALPTSSLHALVPVSTRGNNAGAGGNQLSAFVTTLATDVIDPVERLTVVTRTTNAVKQRHDETGLDALAGLTDVVPPVAGQGLARLAGRLRVSRWGPLAFNVVVSNVPGPDVPFYCNGALVESAFPMGPLTDWSAINVTVVSYRRFLAFGLVACPDVVSDIDGLRRDFDAEIDALSAVGSGR